MGLGLTTLCNFYYCVYDFQGLNFEIMPSLFEEDLDPRKFQSHGDYAVETAYRKVLDVSDRLSKDSNPPDIIIGADTVVSLDGKVFGKPEDAKMAYKFLEQLVCLISN